MTCAQWLKNDLAEAVAIDAFIPIIGWIDGLFRTPKFIRQGEDIARLNAATIIVNNEDSESTIYKAHRHLDIFIEKAH